MKRLQHVAPLAALIAGVLLLAPAMASAQAENTGPKATINGTQVRIDYPKQFEQATLRVSKGDEVWTEVFSQGSTISGDLAVLMGGAISDGFYRYQIEFVWAGAAEPQTVSGGFKVAGGRIQAPEARTANARAASGPTPQADLFVDGTLRVSGPACLECASNAIVFSGKLDIYDNNTGISGTNYKLDGSSVTWTVGNNNESFFVSRGAFGNVPLAIEAGAPDTALYIRNSGNVGVGTSAAAGKLHVSRASANADLFVERTGTGAAVALLSAQSDSVAFGTLSADPFVIATNNVGRVVIGAGGGVAVTGDFSVTGAKNFVEPHPTDSSKSIYYAAMEGPEAGTYVRGSAILVKGVAIIDLPEHFAMVTDEKDLTVQLTPRGEWLQAYVVQVSPRKLVLRERNGKSGRIDYRVEGVRKGYADYQVIRNRTDGTK